jgi:nucleoid DNA-binding protein
MPKLKYSTNILTLHQIKKIVYKASESVQSDDRFIARKATVDYIIDTFLEVVKESLLEDKRITMPKFCTFCLKPTSAGIMNLDAAKGNRSGITNLIEFSASKKPSVIFDANYRIQVKNHYRDYEPKHLLKN